MTATVPAIAATLWRCASSDVIIIGDWVYEDDVNVRSLHGPLLSVYYRAVYVGWPSFARRVTKARESSKKVLQADELTTD